MPQGSTARATLAIYWRHICRYPKHVWGLALGVPLTVLIYQFLPPIILANVLSRLSRHDFRPHGIWGSFGLSLALYGLMMLFGGMVAWRIIDVLDWTLEANVERNMANEIFAHLLEQSADFHANRFGGSLVSQTNKFLAAYIRLADTTVFQLLPLLSSLLFASVILAGRAPLFVALLLLFSAFYMISAMFVTRHVRRLSALQSSAESAQTGYLADSITNVLAIKSFAGRQFESERFAGATGTTYERSLAVMRGTQRQMMYFSGVNGTISTLSLVMAVVGVMVFRANLATVFLILNYTANIVNQLLGFSNSSLRNYNRALGDAADMTRILGCQPDIRDPDQPEPSRIHRGTIDFKSVGFTHQGAETVLFRDLTLHIKAGEKVGLVGHSGSGKTTLTRLLLRFSDIDSGWILIDGQDITRITQDDLRSRIAYVPQEPIMFHRSLRENIRYGQMDASNRAIESVALTAHAHDFIKLLPQGYDTLVGERGVKLSGGQRQRIAIARALLKNAPILVLDEATSALDSESESLIQDALWKLMDNRTAIVIAHRLSTIQRMDRIVVLENGKIVEQGTHRELIRQNGTYANLWQHQSGGFLED